MQAKESCLQAENLATYREVELASAENQLFQLRTDFGRERDQLSQQLAEA